MILLFTTGLCGPHAGRTGVPGAAVAAIPRNKAHACNHRCGLSLSAAPQTAQVYGDSGIIHGCPGRDRLSI